MAEKYAVVSSLDKDVWLFTNHGTYGYTKAVGLAYDILSDRYNNLKETNDYYRMSLCEEEPYKEIRITGLVGMNGGEENYIASLETVDNKGKQRTELQVMLLKEV